MNFGPQKGHVAFIFENFFNDFDRLLVKRVEIRGLTHGEAAVLPDCGLFDAIDRKSK